MNMLGIGRVLAYRLITDKKDFIEDEAAISKSVEIDITDTEKEYEKVDRIIERLNLSNAEKETLLLCMHGYGAFSLQWSFKNDLIENSFPRKFLKSKTLEIVSDLQGLKGSIIRGRSSARLKRASPARLDIPF